MNLMPRGGESASSPAPPVSTLTAYPSPPRIRLDVSAVSKVELPKLKAGKLQATSRISIPTPGILTRTMRRGWPPKSHRTRNEDSLLEL
ncbi:hypothetical protein LINGRAHAP2_LOCUS9836 [Linum grandiflorum]